MNTATKIALIVVNMPNYNKFMKSDLSSGLVNIEDFLFLVLQALKNEKTAKEDILNKLSSLDEKISVQKESVEYAEIFKTFQIIITGIYNHILEFGFYVNGIFDYIAISIKGEDVLFLRRDLYFDVLKREAKQCII